MTVKEAASKLDLPVWTVWKLCTGGALPSWRAEGRILIMPCAVTEFARVFPNAA